MATSPDDARVEARPSPARPIILVVAVLLVLFLIWFLFLRGGDDPDLGAVAPPPAPVTETPETEDTVSPPKKNGPVETFEVFAPKDPFDPLVSPATAGEGTQTTGDTGGTDTETADGGEGTTTTTTDANGNTTTTTTTTGSSGGNGDSGGEDVGGRRVRVIDVFAGRNGRRAQVQVDGTVYTVDEGERFATNFQLLSTSGQCATMLFGDDEFTLCEGEEILK